MPPRRRPRRVFWPWLSSSRRTGRVAGQIVEAEPHSESETDGTKGCKWNEF